MTDSFYLQNEGIVTKSAHANIDFYWGPWTSVNDNGDTTSAFTNIPVGKRAKGLKFGVINGNSVKEYIFITEGATTGAGVKELALIKDDLHISSDASEITYTPTGGTQTYVASKLDSLDYAVSGLLDTIENCVMLESEGNTTQFLRSGGTGDATWDNIDGNDVTIDVENLDHFNNSTSATPLTSDSLQNVIDEIDKNLGNLKYNIDNLDDVDDDIKSNGVKVNVDLNGDTLPYKFEIKNYNGAVVGTIEYSRDSMTNLLKLNFDLEGADSFDVTVPTLRYNLSSLMLQYNNGNAWENIVKVTNLLIKSVLTQSEYDSLLQNGDLRLEGDYKYAIGDLILVGPDTNNYHDLKVCTSAYISSLTNFYTWGSLGKINLVSLQADAISYSDTDTSLSAGTVQVAIEKIVEGAWLYDVVTAQNQITLLDDPTFS